MQKITPFLWFDTQAEEAVNFYTTTFPNSKIESIKRYPTDIQVGPDPNMKGKILTAVFDISGYKFMALDGGPVFKFNPSVSFHYKCSTPEEVDNLWEKFSDGGTVKMELGEYPFSKRYGWVEDKYGVNWQIIQVDEPFTERITPVLMFTENVCGKAEEAANFYASVFKNSSAQVLARYEKGEEPDVEGTVKYAHMILEGQDFGAMDSARTHGFTFNEAISFQVDCDGQEEVDYYWEKLSAVPESEQCGWLKDKFGVSWQIIPKQLIELMSDPDREKANRATQAMLKMKKIDIAELEKAANSS